MSKAGLSGKKNNGGSGDISLMPISGGKDKGAPQGGVHNAGGSGPKETAPSVKAPSPAPKAEEAPKSAPAPMPQKAPEKPVAEGSIQETLKRNTDTIKQTDTFLTEVRHDFTDGASDYVKAIDLKISSLEEEIEALEKEKSKVMELAASMKVF